MLNMNVDDWRQCDAALESLLTGEDWAAAVASVNADHGIVIPDIVKIAHGPEHTQMMGLVVELLMPAAEAEHDTTTDFSRIVAFSDNDGDAATLYERIRGCVTAFQRLLPARFKTPSGGQVHVAFAGIDPAPPIQDGTGWLYGAGVIVSVRISDR